MTTITKEFYVLKVDIEYKIIRGRIGNYKFDKNTFLSALHQNMNGLVVFFMNDIVKELTSEEYDFLMKSTISPSPEALKQLLLDIVKDSAYDGINYKPPIFTNILKKEYLEISSGDFESYLKESNSVEKLSTLLNTFDRTTSGFVIKKETEQYANEYILNESYKFLNNMVEILTSIISTGKVNYYNMQKYPSLVGNIREDFWVSYSYECVDFRLEFYDGYFNKSNVTIYTSELSNTESIKDNLMKLAVMSDNPEYIMAVIDYLEDTSDTQITVEEFEEWVGNDSINAPKNLIDTCKEILKNKATNKDIYEPNAWFS